MVMVYQPTPYAYQKVRRSGRRGGATTAVVVLLAVLATAVGFGAEALRGWAVQARLSQAVDAAALAGGRVFFDTQRDGHIRSFFAAAFPSGYLGARPGAIAIQADHETGTLTVTARATVGAIFQRLLGEGEMTMQAVSVVRRPSRGSDPVLARGAGDDPA